MIDIDVALKVMDDFHKTLKKVHKKKEETLYSKIEIKVLYLIDDSEVITMKEISNYLDITKPRVTVIVNKLIEKELVSYILDSNDKRKKHLSITKLGQKYLQVEKEKHIKFFAHIWSNFSKEEQEQWLSITKKTIEIIKIECLSKEKNDENI